MRAHGDFAVLFHQFGLAAVFVVLLLENFGLPLPGEIVLLLTGSQIWRLGPLGFAELAAVATLACVAGQAVGYAIGERAGHWVERRYKLVGARRRRIEGYFARHGFATVVAARFVTGLRVLAGPAAGMCGMPWRLFMMANVTGAAAWVLAVSGTGAALGRDWRRLLPWLRRFDLLLLAVAAVAAIIAWRRWRDLDKEDADAPAHA